MTRIEALRTLTRYMPERSIHITESLDSSYHLGDRRDDVMALVTINPGLTQTMPECFAAPTIETAVQRALDAIGSITFLNRTIIGTVKEDVRSGQVVEIDRADGLIRAARFNQDQHESFAALNAQ